MTNNRAYSVLDIKSVDDEKRTIEGIASTPSVDRMDDIVELDGMDYSIPLPFLYQHDSSQPIGHVTEARKTSTGLQIRVQIASAGIADHIDKAWRLIKSGLVRGLSIGFRSKKAEPLKTGGLRFIKTEVYEISAVTVAANAEASILTVKSADTETLAALGRGRQGVVRLTQTQPGVTGISKRGSPVTIKEQIAGLEAKRAANEARIDELIKKSADEGTTFDEAEQEEHDTLEREVTSIDKHLTLLRKRQERLSQTAQPVTHENTAGPEKAAATRQGTSPITVKSMAPPGIGVARMAIAMIRSNNNAMVAADMARKYWPDAPEVELSLKAVVEAGDTTTSGWASQLVPSAQQMQDEFLELLRPATIIGRIPGLRRVPFNISVPIETASGTAQWVGEGAPKPVTKLTLSSVTLRWAKAAAIVAITKELAKFSRPDAEMVVRDSMIKTLVRFFDAHFISATAEVTNVSPAGILNGISAVTASGTTPAAFRTDLNNMLNNMTANNVSLEGVVLLMSTTQAVALSLMQTDLGVPLFQNITRAGGTIFGFPVVVSEAVGTKIIAVNAPDILLASDPGVMVDVSDQASVEMDDAPAVGESSPVTTISTLKSFWQNNLIGVRVEQFITWKRGRDAAVEYVNGNAYVPS